MTDKPRGKATAHIEEYQDARVQKRRQSDRCIAKRVYDAATPYVQIAGWLPIIGGIFTAVYLICNFISTTQSYGESITAVDSKVDKVNERVLDQQQDIASLKRGQEDMAHEVHIIYSHLIGDGHAHQ